MKLNLESSTGDADEQLLPLIQDIDFDPIFILGDHRSGTTLLYQLLASTQYFNYANFYHITHYDEILQNHIKGNTASAKEKLNQLLQSLGLHDRIFDGVRVSPDLPEEYGYILWREAPFWYLPRLNHNNVRNLLELGAKVQFTQTPGRPVLLKGPWDFPNFAFAKSVFPKARFIFIHRHPIHVINSKLKAMRSALAEMNPYTALLAPGYARLFRRPVQLFIARLLFSSHLNMGLRLLLQYSSMAGRYFLKYIGSLSQKEYVSVRYEDLCERPEDMISRVLRHLGFKPEKDIRGTETVDPRNPDLLPEVTENYTLIRQQLRTIMEMNGYFG